RRGEQGRTLPDLRARSAQARQCVRRTSGGRADGCNDVRPSGHAGACRCLLEHNPGGAMNTAAPPRRPLNLDPIPVEVIGSALASIVEETGEALVRASYSTNIKERRDCSTALFNTRGETLCQA